MIRKNISLFYQSTNNVSCRIYPELTSDESLTFTKLIEEKEHKKMKNLHFYLVLEWLLSC